MISRIYMDKNAVSPQHLQLCLDFANTMDWHASEQPVETLQRYADLVAWAQRGNLLTDQAARQLVLRAERSPAEGKRVLAHALALREATYRIFVAAGGAHTPPTPQSA